MTFGSLFAGIGGFDLGLERAGMHGLWQVEIDPLCRKLLAAKFPNAEKYKDVCQCGKSNLASVDLICGGFPCQDLSVAGKRAGLDGHRSGLFYEMARITHELKPAFLLWENVPGLFSSDEGRDLARVMLELDRIGYCGAWRTLDARYFGLAQRRRRIFGLFTRLDSGAEHCAEILSLAEGLRGHPAPSREAGQGVAGSLGGSSQSGGLRTTDPGNQGAYVPTICPAIKSRDSKGVSSDGDGDGATLVAFSCKDHGADTGELSPTLRAMPHDRSHENGGGQIAVAQTITAEMYRSGGAVAGNNSQGVRNVLIPAVRRLTPMECERLQGFPDGWTAGFSDSVRYRMLGNALSVPVMEWIGHRLLRFDAARET